MGMRATSYNMNIVNMSMLMKKPKTPALSSVNHRKYSLFMSQETKVPVKTMTAESNSIATEMPSTPTEYLMCRGLIQSKDAVNSISASFTARSFRNITVSTAAAMSSTVLPATMTARIPF